MEGIRIHGASVGCTGRQERRTTGEQAAGETDSRRIRRYRACQYTKQKFSLSEMEKSEGEKWDIFGNFFCKFLFTFRMNWCIIISDAIYCMKMFRIINILCVKARNNNGARG